MKRFSLWLLAALFVALLAACGNSGAGSTAGGTTAGQAGAATEQAAGAATAEATEEAAGGVTAEATEEATMAAPAEATEEATEAVTAEATEEAPTVAATSQATQGAAGGALPDLGGRKVVVGTDATYPPFESVDPTSNQIVGFDVDLMNAIGDLINIEPEFQNASFTTIFAALDAKQFDAVMSAATITEERKKVVAFSDPYFQIGQLVVAGADSDTVQSYEDLAGGPTVGVQTGTTGETAAATVAQVPEDKLRRYDTIDLAFADLANGSIDAVVADQPTVDNYTSQPQYQGKLRVVGEAFTTEDYGIAVHREDTELLNAINAALAQIKTTTTIEDLKTKHEIK